MTDSKQLDTSDDRTRKGDCDSMWESYCTQCDWVYSRSHSHPFVQALLHQETTGHITEIKPRKEPR